MGLGAVHQTAYALGGAFIESYWSESFSRVLDVGSLNVNGTLRDFAPAGAEYMGVDLAPGPGVDLVIADPHKLPLADNAYDLIVSTSCFEHDPLFWLTFLEMVRVAKPGGFIYINAPSNGFYHAYPFDCFRFYPDSARGLAEWAGLNGTPVRLVESFMEAKKGDQWTDMVMIFGKGETLAPPVSLLSDIFPTAYNIRRHDREAMIRPMTWTEDQRDLKELRRGLLPRLARRIGRFFRPGREDQNGG